jgi:acetyltransferase-like isoleucine patch superfamily enzyme
MLAAMARIVEGLLALFPRWILPPLVIEAVARTLGGAVRLLVPRVDMDGERRLRGALSAARLKTRGLRIGRRVEIEGLRNVALEDDVTLYGDIFLGAYGTRGELRIGKKSHIDRQSVIHGEGGVRIGRGCAIAAGVIVYSQTNRFDASPEGPILDQGTEYDAVAIGDDVWIGAGAVVLPGVSIGDHAVVAAGAVVRNDVSEWKIVAGVPAREIRDRRVTS